jgi:nucleoside-diphosphate-sugar epimerase
MTKKVLIIGGNRFLGPAIIQNLLKENCDITIFNRGNNYGYHVPENVKEIIGDRKEKKDLQQLRKKNYDFIYDMCCFDKNDAISLLDTINPQAHIIFLSSAAVYKKPIVFPLYEESMLGAWDSFGNYGLNKLAAEIAYITYIKKHKLKLTVFRPVYLLGNKNYFDRENYYFSRIVKGLPILVPGNGNALIQFAFLQETATAFATIPFMQKDQIEVLNIGGDEYISVADIVTLCSRVVGRPAKIINVHMSKFHLEETMFYDNLYPFPNLNFIVSNKKIKEKYHSTFVELEKGLKQIYNIWSKNWDGKVQVYPKEKEILKNLKV